MRIASVATAYPPYRYPQSVITEALKTFRKNKSTESNETRLMDRLHSNCGVEFRHLMFPIDSLGRFSGFGASNDAWIEGAIKLGGAAATAGAAGAAGAAAKAGGASKWLGPLAGIAAGGLLASMFMGGGFQGMQIFDILIMAVIAFVIFRFIAARRRKQQEHLAPAGAPMQREVFEQKPAAMGSIFGGSAAPVAE